MTAFTSTAELLFKEILQVDLERDNFFCQLPSDLSIIIQEHLDICRKGRMQKFSHSHSGIILECILSPVISDNSRINQVSVIINFINSEENVLNSEENKTDKDLEYNKQIYSNLFYNNPDAVFSFDLEGNFNNANFSSAKLAETSKENLLKMNFLPFVPDSDREKVLQHFQKATEGEIQNYRMNFQSVAGTRRILDISNFPIKYKNEIVGVYGIAKDITLQQETEKRILEERQMLRAIIDNIPDYIFVKDRQHRSILSNQKFYKHFLGNSSDECSKGYTPLDYFDLEKAQEIIKDNEVVMQHDQPVINRPDIVNTVDGKQEMVLLTKVPLKDQNDETIGLVGIARDITETYLHNKKQELIFKVIKAVGDEASFEGAMIQTLKILCEDLRFDYAEAYKISVNDKKIVRSAFWPPDKDLSSKDRIYKKGEGLPGKVWESRKVEVIRKSDQTGLLEDMLLNDQASIKSAVGIPIIFEEKLISVFCLGSVEDSKKIEAEVLCDINLQIASAIESKRSQEQLNDFYEYSPNLIAVIGMDGFMKKINPSFTEKFGFTQNEILTKPFTDFIHPEDLPKTYDAIENLSVGDVDFEIRCKKKSGDYLWISWRFSRFFRKENVVFIYGTDITPLKNALSELSENIKERKIVQGRLEESEKKYRTLFDASPLPMWVLDRDNLKFLQVNQAAINLYGYSEKEFSKMTVRDLWAPEQEENINKVVADNYNDFFRVKVKHLKKNGDPIYVSVNSNPVIFDGIEARVSLVKDVTARVEAERLLQHSEQRFKALIQDGSDLISIVDADYNYIYNSPASKTVFGLEPSVLSGTNFKDYIHKEDIEKVNIHLAKLTTQKRIQLPSYRVKGPKNNWRWIETIITNLENEAAIGGIVMNSRDITEFVEQERELMESLKRYDIVAKATSDVITDYDIDKEEMKVSNASYELFGYQVKDGIYSGKWWNEKIHPEDYKKVRAAAEQMMQNNKKNLTIEYRFKCADGSYKYILDRSYLITDENNSPKRIIGSMQDITDRKNHLIAIENHNRRLKEIAWTQSHVVRAPLAKVMGLVDMLKNYRDDLDNIDELFDNILISANELDSIIRDIAVQTEKEL